MATITAWRFYDDGSISLATTMPEENKGDAWLTYNELQQDPRFKAWAKPNIVAEDSTPVPRSKQSGKRSELKNLEIEVPQDE